MAGRPKRAALVKAVKAAGGEEALLRRIENGETVKKIAEDLGMSRPLLSGFLNRDADARERLARARETSAHALIEEALAIADSATHEDDRAKRLQVSMRQWLAAKRNRRDYGEEPLVQNNVSIAQLQVEALRRVNAEAEAKEKREKERKGEPQDVVVEASDNDPKTVRF